MSVLKVNTSPEAPTLHQTNIVKTNNSLNVRELTPNEKNKLIKITDTWNTFAQSKASQSSPTQKVFEDSSSLCKYIISALNDKTNKYKFYVCTQAQKDTDVEAIAVISEKVSSVAKPHLYVEFLMTHPKNIRSPLNENEPNRVTGAATKIISYLAEVAKQRRIDEIHLFSLNSARGFYEKIGFIDKGGSNMVLTIKKEGETVKPPELTFFQWLFGCKQVA